MKLPLGLRLEPWVAVPGVGYNVYFFGERMGTVVQRPEGWFATGPHGSSTGHPDRRAALEALVERETMERPE